ncbi:MAG: hypothetical protein ACRC0L_11980 [Angustibacter sp.]
MHLDGGDYRPETVPFSLAFAEYAGAPGRAGGTVVIHRTAWNRLEHHLDYFHGALVGDRVLYPSNGSNVATWTPERKPSPRSLSQPAYAAPERPTPGRRC